VDDVVALNFLDIVEVDSQVSLLKVSVKPDLSLLVSFWDAPYATVTAPLSSLTTFTKVTVAYDTNNQLAVWTTALVGAANTATVGSAVTNLSGMTFHMYASMPNEASAGGVLRNIAIHGEFHSSIAYNL
jgi:hypothetical protein